MLRDVTSKQLLDLFSQGLTENNGNKVLSALESEILNVSMLLSDQGKLSQRAQW
jgi:hypothetical protein